MDTPSPTLAPISGPARPVRVHGLADTRAALTAAAALGVPVTLVGPPGGGALWFLGVVNTAQAAVPGVEAVAVVDCGENAGEAQGALAAGARHVLFTGPAEVAARLAEISARSGAVLLTALPEALDLRGRRDPEAACRAWLASG